MTDVEVLDADSPDSDDATATVERRPSWLLGVGLAAILAALVGVALTNDDPVSTDDVAVSSSIAPTTIVTTTAPDTATTTAQPEPSRAAPPRRPLQPNPSPPSPAT